MPDFAPHQLKNMAAVTAIADWYQNEFLASKEAGGFAEWLNLLTNNKQGWNDIAQELADATAGLYHKGPEHYENWLIKIDALRMKIRSQDGLFQGGTNSRLASALEFFLQGKIPLANVPAANQDKQNGDGNPLIKIVKHLAPAEDTHLTQEQTDFDPEDHLQRHFIKRAEKPILDYQATVTARDEKKPFTLVRTIKAKRTALDDIKEGFSQFYQRSVEQRKALIEQYQEGAGGTPSIFNVLNHLLNGPLNRGECGRENPVFSKAKFSTMLNSVRNVLSRAMSFDLGTPANLVTTSPARQRSPSMSDT